MEIPNEKLPFTNPQVGVIWEFDQIPATRRNITDISNWQRRIFSLEFQLFPVPESYLMTKNQFTRKDDVTSVFPPGSPTVIETDTLHLALTPDVVRGWEARVEKQKAYESIFIPRKQPLTRIFPSFLFTFLVQTDEEIRIFGCEEDVTRKEWLEMFQCVKMLFAPQGKN
eukprot:GEMP01048612.1.p1 GENE.GEMP01048612.1~~GEMP01048612.1.p1  ORF type:complete len:169 (+),score=24.48 GEMP01048612.1:163-669(+)